MAATTTAPYLFSIEVVPTNSDRTTFLINTVWRGNKLADGSLVELVHSSAYGSTDPIDTAGFGDMYSDAYEAWTTLTGDDTHSASPIDLTPP